MGRKFIRFELTENLPNGTSLFTVYNNITGERLATIEWFDKWRKYCLFPFEDTAWEVECLTEVIAYIKDLMKYIKKPKNTRQKTLQNIVTRGQGDKKE